MSCVRRGGDDGALRERRRIAKLRRRVTDSLVGKKIKVALAARKKR